MVIREKSLTMFVRSTGLSSFPTAVSIPKITEFYSQFPSGNGFSRCSSVNLQAYVSGVTLYASAQARDFLATTENCSFPIRKRNDCHPVFLDNNELFCRFVTEKAARTKIVRLTRACRGTSGEVKIVARGRSDHRQFSQTRRYPLQ